VRHAQLLAGIESSVLSSQPLAEDEVRMPEYRYELRRGDEVIATGHLSSEQPFEVGERITIGSRLQGGGG
jgi:hypothetical protein